jgi:excisionase family DNA binding protein
MDGGNGAANFADWKPKMEIAAELGISERSLERLIQKNRIRRAYRRVPGRKPIAVLNPEDVAALKAETIEPTPTETLTEPRTDVAVRSPTPHAALNFLSSLLATVPQHPQALFLTVKEASLYTGLSQAYLRRLIDDGTLKVVKDRGYRIRRRDLDQL